MKRLSFESVLLTYLLAGLTACMDASLPPQLIIYYAENAIYKFEASTLNLQLLETAPCIGSIIGSFIISHVATLLGKRRSTVWCAGAACVISIAILVPVSFGYLYVMRVMLGAFAYGCNAIAPGWLQELFPHLQLSIFFEVFISSNVLICEVLSFLVLQPRLWWLPQIYGIVSAALCTFVAWESDKTVGVDETSLIQTQRVPIHRQRNYSICEPAAGKSLVNAVLIGFGVEVSGISRVLFGLYSTTLQKVERSIFTLIRLLIGLVMTFLNKKINRKTMLICGIFVGAAGNLSMAMSDYLEDRAGGLSGNAQEVANIISEVFSIVGFVALTLGYEVGPGFLQYMLCAEVFPRKYSVRLSAVVFATAATTQLLAYLFFVLMKNLTGYANLVLSVLALWNGVVLVSHMPETRGKSKREVEQEVLGEYYLEDF